MVNITMKVQQNQRVPNETGTKNLKFMIDGFYSKLVGKYI